ncbi:MAG: helix-turn-helix domain-containing protein [Bacteroidales bacterium]|nr:helix-turn-helix domain-containing protein [Bacteroidales bacterium]
MAFLIKTVLLILLQNSFMSTTKNGKIVVAGDDFSWIEGIEKDLNQPEELDANVRIALRLRQCMKERGWSQKDLAAALGVSPQYVNKILRNQDPSFSVKIAEEYGKRLNYPLIRVCDDATLDSTIYMRKDILSVNSPLLSVDIWRLLTNGVNGFQFGSIKELSSKRHCKNQIALNYA